VILFWTIAIAMTVILGIGIWVIPLRWINKHFVRYSDYKTDPDEMFDMEDR
jgi:hypothetical protein